jgi:hypothetical protein
MRIRIRIHVTKMMQIRILMRIRIRIWIHVTKMMLHILPSNQGPVIVCAVPHAAHHRDILRLLDVDREDHADMGKLFQVPNV